MTSDEASDPNEAAPTDDVVTVYVNDQRVDLPGPPGRMWAIWEITRKAARAGIISQDSSAAEANGTTFILDVCRTPPCVGMLRVQVNGGERFDFRNPTPPADSGE